MSRPVFVIPHYSKSEQSWAFLGRTLTSLLEQTDPEWDAIIVDDCSPSSGKDELLDEARAMDPARIHVLHKSKNEGPGSARNVGVAWAAERRAPFVLFQDADDMAHADRLRITREYFRRRPDVAFVYSTFEVMNEKEQPVSIKDVTPSIREILQGHTSDPIEGLDQWLRIALEKGYTTHTSTVAVRTHLAAAHPFPTTYVSEDSHTWLRMLAAGTAVGFVKRALARRRICTSVKGSATRQRFGDNFYWIKLQVDLDGFTRALDIARTRSRISDEDAMFIRRGFHLRQAKTMAREKQELAATLCLGLASLALQEAQRRASQVYVEGGVAA